MMTKMRPTTGSRRAFSLIEVLMAILILALGVISIAALLPAGIHQQRRAVDDVTAPIVANNALSIIRTRVRPEDFGSFPDWTPQGAASYLNSPLPTVPSDWSWLRPAHIFEDNGNTDSIDEFGAIDIFGWSLWNDSGIAHATEFPGGYVDPAGLGSPVLQGIPWKLPRGVNPGSTTAEPPRAIITRYERWYPQGDQAVPAGRPAPRPEYMWDCMFRRYQGRVMVAVFVYRVTREGGEGERGWVVPPDVSFPEFPPLPLALTLGDFNDPDGAWDAFDEDGRPNEFLDGTAPCTDYDITDKRQSWQEPGQWILDQNNTIHRVLAADCTTSTNEPRVVQLVDAIPQIAGLPIEFGLLGGVAGSDNVVSNVWYIPRIVTTAGGDEFRLTPVYLLVKEL